MSENSDKNSNESEDEQDNRVTASLAGLAFILLLAVLGLMLVHVLQNKSQTEDCLMSGRTNCMPLESGR